MPYRALPFVTGEIYHLYNRGLEKQQIFTNSRDYQIFIEALFYYLMENPKPKFSLYRRTKTFPVKEDKKMVEVICFCLMTNHFHLMVKQTRDGGISEFMRKFIHSYNKYRNVKYKRQGPIFQGVFKATHIDSDELLIHVSRYIHLNPLVSNLVKDLKKYPYSSYMDFIEESGAYPLAREIVLNFFKSPKEYEKFVLDQADYGMSLEKIKHLAIDLDKS